MKSESIKDVYNFVCNYEVNWVTDFYQPFLRFGNNVPTRLQKARVRKVFAYPQPTTTSSEQRLDKSIAIICRLLSEIGSIYIGLTEPNFKESYNSYKHGYRILSSKDNKNKIQVIIYLAQTGKLSYIPVDNRSIKVILDIKKYCRVLLETMLTNNRIRYKLAKSGISQSSEEIAFVHKRSRNYKITKKLSQLTIKNKKHNNNNSRSIYLIH